jgi:hypothetical protein
MPPAGARTGCLEMLTSAGDRANALELWERAYHDPENANHPETMATVEFNRATALLLLPLGGLKAHARGKAPNLKIRPHDRRAEHVHDS